MPTQRFSRTLARLEEAVNPEAPYDLQNARVEPASVVRALKDGAPSAETVTSQPVRRWNGELLQRSFQGRTLFGATRKDDRLYLSTDGGITPLPKGYVGTFTEVAPPHLTGAITFDDERFGYDNTDDDDRPRIYVGYLFVPISARGEAGAWRYAWRSPRALTSPTYSETYGAVTLNGDLPIAPPTTISAPVSGEVSEVAVYRTLQFSADGYPFGVTHEGIYLPDLPDLPGDLDGGLEQLRDLILKGQRDDSFYYLGRFPVTDGVMTGRDAQVLIHPVAATLYGVPQGALQLLPPGYTGPVAVTSLITPSERLDRERNRFATREGGTPSDQSVLVPFARHAHKDGGRALYGDVTIPTAGSNDVGVFFRLGGLGSKDIALVREYRSGGDTYFGPATTLPATSSLKVAWTNETALRVYVKSGGTYRLYERLVPSEEGEYLTEVVREGSASPYPLTFDAEAYDADRLGESGLPDPVDSYSEAFAVLYSDVNRPWEVLLRGFETPDDEPLRLLGPLTASGEDAVTRHTLLVGTGKGLFFGRYESGTHLFEAVTQQFGVAEAQEPGGTAVPVYAACKNFPVVWGTNKRLVALFGRDNFEYLDTAIREGDKLFNDCYGLAYEPEEDELYCLTDRGIWLYAFDRGGFVAQYDLPYGTGAGECDVLWYDEKEQAVLVRTNGAAKHLNETGEPLVAAVTTQRVSVYEDQRVGRVVVDADGAIPTLDGSEGRLTVQHAVRHPNVNQIGESDPDKITVSKRGEPGRPLDFRELHGRGHQFRVAGFDRVRSVDVGG